jgi:hypothetical protein
MTLLTIFTAPKPFTNPHIAMIQRNAILSWINLGLQVNVMLVGNEPGIVEVAEELGVISLPEVKRNDHGTPLVSSTFKIAQEQTDSPLLAYINADILVLPDFLSSALAVLDHLKQFLILGRRWDLDIVQPLDFSPGWDQRLTDYNRQYGKLHAPSGSDYFIYPHDGMHNLPDFAIGRPCWDNWMIYSARRQGVPVVNATNGITIIHQSHDYSHLPGGKPPYGGPEARANIQQAGSSCTIFFQHDANWYLFGKDLKRPTITWKKFWREVEIFPLISLHSDFLGQIFYWIFHPLKAYQQFRKWMRTR